MPQSRLTTPSPFTAPLLAWYRANARPLPWRETQDPYPIWVSEIMLQQTRVAAVMGYYARFLAAFPSVEALARAPEAQLLKLWEGLGYYTRARNLQKAARMIADAPGGRFPDQYEALRALPGVGDYTAAAIAAAAFALPEPAVDGNVLRVFTRLTDCRADIAAAGTRAAVREALRPAMPDAAEDIRIFNQALMELGAVVCVPNGPPKCDACPVASLCLARARGTADQLPIKSPKKPRRAEERTVFLFLRGGRTALRRRPEGGLLAGLWEFPGVDGRLSPAEAGAQALRWGLTPTQWRRSLSAKHIFTHVEWHMTGYVLEVSGTGAEELLWVDAPALDTLAVPSAFARFLAEARTLLSGGNAASSSEVGS